MSLMSCAFHEINWNDTQGIGYCQFSFRLLELLPYKRPFECLELVIQFGMHSLTVKTYTLGAPTWIVVYSNLRT